VKRCRGGFETRPNIFFVRVRVIVIKFFNADYDYAHDYEFKHEVRKRFSSWIFMRFMVNEFRFFAVPDLFQLGHGVDQ